MIVMTDQMDRLRSVDALINQYGDDGLRESAGGVSRTVDRRQGFGNLASAGSDSFTFGQGLVHMEIGGQSRWVITDALGSVRVLVDDSGAVTDTYVYSAFGELVHRTGSTPLVFGFAGEEYDSATGYYYLRARYYDPTTGRFLSMDPVDGSNDRPLSHNDYVYAEANPVGRFDPSGEFSLMETQFAQRIQQRINQLYQTNRAEALRQLKKKAIETLEHEAYVYAIATIFRELDTFVKAIASETGVGTL